MKCTLVRICLGSEGGCIRALEQVWQKWTHEDGVDLAVIDQLGDFVPEFDTEEVRAPCQSGLGFWIDVDAIPTRGL